MKILSTVDKKLIIQSERFEPGRLKLSDPSSIAGSIVVPLVSISIIYSDYNRFSHLFSFSYKSFIGILVLLIELYSSIYVLFLNKPKYLPSSIFEIGVDRILVREWKGLWYDPVITRVFELENVESIEVVLDAKSDISWNSDMDMYMMGAPLSNYQVITKSVTGKQYKLEENSIDLLTIHPIALTAFCELIEETKRSVREIEKFLNENDCDNLETSEPDQLVGNDKLDGACE